MTAEATTFPGRSIQRDEPDNIIRVGLQDKSSVHDEPDKMTKAEHEELMQEAILAAMLAIPKLGISQAKPNGQGSQRATIIAALVISFIPQAFSVVWWTRGTERDTASRVLALEKSDVIREREMRLMQQYNMNLQLWLREHGVKGAPTPPVLNLNKENDN